MLRTAILLLSSTVIITCLPESDWSSLHPTASTKHREAQISHVPGYASNRLPSKHYGGYITVDEDHGRRLYYYFVTSERSPSRDPVVLWLNGGPGCSSFDGVTQQPVPASSSLNSGSPAAHCRAAESMPCPANPSVALPLDSLLLKLHSLQLQPDDVLAWLPACRLCIRARPIQVWVQGWQGLHWARTAAAGADPQPSQVGAAPATTRAQAAATRPCLCAGGPGAQGM